MGGDCDSRYGFTDNQGNDFDIWASSAAEAGRLAQVTIQERDAENHNPESSGDWRVDKIHKVAEGEYQKAMRWHEQRQAAGCDPRSGLPGGIGYVPLEDENQQTQRVVVNDPQSHTAQTGGGKKESSLGCIEWVIIGAVVVGLIIFMLLIV